MTWEIQWHDKSGCENFGAVVLINTSLGSSVVESNSKEVKKWGSPFGRGKMGPSCRQCWGGWGITLPKSLPHPSTITGPKRGHEGGLFRQWGFRGKTLRKFPVTPFPQCCLSILKRTELSVRERMGTQLTGSPWLGRGPRFFGSWCLVP